MKLKISKAMLLIAAAISIVLYGCKKSDNQGSDTMKAKPAAPDASLSLAVPANQAYTGSYIDFGEHEDTVTYEAIRRFEQMVGKEQALIAFSSDWGKESFPEGQLRIVSNYGAMPLVFWSPWDRPLHDFVAKEKNRFSLKTILSGQWDAYIDMWAQKAAEFKKPFFVSFGLEMNGNWFPWCGVFYGGGTPKPDACAGCFEGPETFKKAYRYVIDRVRARGTKNIIWIWHPNNTSDPDQSWNAMANYYPGDSYADWMALSAYGKQYPAQGWVLVKSAITLPYQELIKVAPNKPIMLAEWGIAEFPKEGSKGKWIEEVFSHFQSDWPRIKAAVFWHERWQNGDLSYSNLRVNSSPESLAAYKAGIRSAYWLDRPIFSGGVSQEAGTR